VNVEATASQVAVVGSDGPALDAPRTAGSRAAAGLLLALSSAVGAACATAVVMLTGTLATATPPQTWPLSALLVCIVAALWFHGMVLLAALSVSGTTPTRRQGWLVAFALAPFAVGIFFFAVSVGVTGGLPGGYLAVAVILAFAWFGRRLLGAVSEKLLIGFFLWLGVLVAPILWSDPVNRALSGFLLSLLRGSGVIV
jgi:hypothetical protein